MKCRDEHFDLLRSRWLWKAGGQEDVQKKEIREDKKGCPSGINIFTTLQIDKSEKTLKCLRKY